MYEEVKK